MSIDIEVRTCNSMATGEVVGIDAKARIVAEVGTGWNFDRLADFKVKLNEFLNRELPKCLKGFVA